MDPCPIIDVLRAAVRQTATQAPFRIDAWVVLPDHMRCVWTFPTGDSDFPWRWRAIKAIFSKSPPAEAAPTEAMARRAYRDIWQRGYWEHTIRDDRDYAAHIDYMHFNAVKHGLVANPGDRPFSTSRLWVLHGIYSETWAGDSCGGTFCEMGERS